MSDDTKCEKVYSRGLLPDLIDQATEAVKAARKQAYKDGATSIKAFNAWNALNEAQGKVARAFLAIQ